MMQLLPGWICCQIGAREHYAVARALHRHHALRLLLTDVWVHPERPLGKLSPGLRTRFHPELASAEVHAANTTSVAAELWSKLTGLRDWNRILARNEWFQKMAVKRLSRIKTDAPQTVMAYSYAAGEILKFARSRGWRTILGQIDPGPREDALVAELYEQDPIYRGQFKRPPPRYWSSWREECRFADQIVVNSSWSQSALISEGIPAEKIRVLPLAYEQPKEAKSFRRKYPGTFTGARPLRVLFLGQVNLRKGIGPLLKAIGLLREEPIEFSFVGPIQVTIPPDLRDNPKVRWIGAVSQELTAKFYRDADLFIFPTFSDGFGLTQLEAQAWKLPIIASRCCGDVVKDGENGWQLPEITPEAIAAALVRCRADPKGLEKLSANSLRSGRFDLAAVGKQWLSLGESTSNS
jgi:glycosyltransferase involved in cell wall biosynthesis